jgi:hypothetical protein
MVLATAYRDRGLESERERVTERERERRPISHGEITIL